MRLFEKKPSDIDRFILAMTHMDGAEVAGVARMLGVALDEEKNGAKVPRQIPNILIEMVEKFGMHPKRGRRRLLKIMEDAAQAAPLSDQKKKGGEEK